MASFKIKPGWSHCVKINVVICISLIKPLNNSWSLYIYQIGSSSLNVFFFVCVTPVPALHYLFLECTWLIQPFEMFWMFWEWRTSRSQLDWQPSGETPTRYAGMQPRLMCAPLITQSARSEPNVAQDDADTRGGGACVPGPFTSSTGTTTQGKRSSTLHACWLGRPQGITPQQKHKWWVAERSVTSAGAMDQMDTSDVSVTSTPEPKVRRGFDQKWVHLVWYDLMHIM